jgi:hypothetical protein
MPCQIGLLLGLGLLVPKQVGLLLGLGLPAPRPDRTPKSTPLKSDSDLDSDSVRCLARSKAGSSEVYVFRGLSRVGTTPIRSGSCRGHIFLKIAKAGAEVPGPCTGCCRTKPRNFVARSHSHVVALYFLLYIPQNYPTTRLNADLTSQQTRANLYSASCQSREQRFTSLLYQPAHPMIRQAFAPQVTID